MDADRRHDLEHNALDSELTKFIAWFKENWNRIFWAIIIVGMIFVVLLFAQSYREKSQLREEARFTAIFRNPTPEVEMTLAEQREFAVSIIDNLQDFSQTARDRKLGAQAALMAGDMALDMYLDPMNRRNEQLDRAADIYNQAKGDFADQPIIVAQALYGLGIVAENRYDFDAAREQYNAVLATEGSEGTPVAELAKDRLEMLAELEKPVYFDNALSLDSALEVGLPDTSSQPSDFDWSGFDDFSAPDSGTSDDPFGDDPFGGE
jgi:predicted negative regulator of RcsB-dependent stress response